MISQQQTTAVRSKGGGVELQRELQKQNNRFSCKNEKTYLNKMITAECVFSKQVLAAEFLTSSNDPGALN